MNTKKPIFQYVILILSISLLIANILTFDLEKDKLASVLVRVTSNILIIIAMILSIRTINKKPKA